MQTDREKITIIIIDIHQVILVASNIPNLKGR